MPSDKIIVTGGTGFIGSHTTVELIKKGYNVSIVDNLCNSSIYVLDGIKRITGIKPEFDEIDLTNRDSCNHFFEKHQDAVAVIHFAALKAVGESVAQPLKYYRNNIFSLVNVIDSMTKYGISKLIFSSSATVYGQPEILPATENSPVVIAESPYGNTKQIGEEIIAETCDDLSALTMNAISLRYFNPIGAHPSSEIGELPIGVPNNLMPFITQTAAGLREQLNVFGSDYNTPDGTAIRDYIHIVDLSEAHVVALERLLNNENESNLEVFNLGTGAGHSVLEVIQSFERTSGTKLNYHITSRRPGDVESVYADTTLAKEKLHWQTRLDLDDMTRDAWNWQLRLKDQ